MLFFVKLNKIIENLIELFFFEKRKEKTKKVILEIYLKE